ncbi:30S ribosomal protein S16, partial [Staphylococcus pseudintermedius]
VKIDAELALKWLKDGAKPTDTVHNLLSREGILKTFDEQKKAK